MKKNPTIGSEPSKIHYGGAPKNPSTIPEKPVTTGNRTDDTIVRGAQESNLKKNKEDRPSRGNR
jgi:hypothetical protein